MPATAQDVADCVKTHQEVLSEADVRRIAEDDPTHHEAYEFVYDTPTRRLNGTQVRAMVVRVCALAQPLHAAGVSLAEVRRRVVANADDVRLFATDSHPKLFERITDPATPPGFIDNVCRMVELQCAIDAGRVDDAQGWSAMQNHLLKASTGPRTAGAGR